MSMKIPPAVPPTVAKPTTPASRPAAPAPAMPAAAAPKWSPTGPQPKTPAAAAPAEVPAASRSQAAADASALHRALHPGLSGLGTDEKAVFATLTGKPAAHLNEVKRLYAEHFNVPLEKDLEGDLSGSALTRARALLSGDHTQGTVETLRGAIRGGDHDTLVDTLRSLAPADLEAVHQRYPSLQSDLAARVLGPTKDIALALAKGQRPQADAAALDSALNLVGDGPKALALLGHGDRAAIADAYQLRTGHALEADVGRRLRGTEKDQAIALLKGDTLGVSAAKLRHAIEGKVLGLGKDATAALAILEGTPVDQRKALDTRYQQAYGVSLAADVTARFGGRDGERLTHALQGKLDDVDRIQIALKGYGADKSAIQSVLAGRTPEQAAALKQAFQQRTGASLDGALKKELSGRALFDATLALEGAPQTAEAAVSQAARRREFERGGGANAASRLVMDLVSSDGKRMDQAVTDAQKALAQGADVGRVAELTALAAGDVKQYRDAKESVGDSVAMAAALGATVATGGLGAPLAVGVLAGAGVSVAASAAIAGKGYSTEDATRDAVKGGLGAISAGGAKVATGIAGKAAESAARAGVSGFVSAASDKALQGETWNGGLADGVRKAGVAGATAAVTSAAFGAAQSLNASIRGPTGGQSNVVATKLPSGQIDLSKYETDKAARAALKKAVDPGTYKAEQSMSTFYKKNEAKILKNIPTEDLMGLRFYTGADYTAMNGALRGKSMAELAKQEAKILTASSALAKMPAYKGTVYRQAELSAEKLARYEVGETIAEKAFMSTTSSKTSKFAGNTEFVIKSKGGGKTIDMISNYQAEQEVLFAPGTEFKVLKKAVTNGKTTVFLQEVQ